MTADTVLVGVAGGIGRFDQSRRRWATGGPGLAFSPPTLSLTRLPENQVVPYPQSRRDGPVGGVQLAAQFGIR
ncbi:MAG: hypothetical protein AAF281_14790, partial [Pseudomonadota bacterium]